MLVPLQTNALLHGYPTPLLDFDFVNGAYRQDAVGANLPASNFLTTVRAATGYSDTTAGVWISFANNLPRITNKGLLVEEARTNSIRNNSMQGALAGSPGTLPTNWTVNTFPSGLTRTIALGTENGVDVIDIGYNGTPGSTTSGFLSFDSSTLITASNNQSWSGSVFIKLQGGSLTNIGQITFSTSERDGAGVNLGTTSSNCTPTSALTRVSALRTNTSASTAFETAFITIPFTSGQAVDFTLRIGWPQLELGAVTTSPIRTTSATVTRSADFITVTTPPVFGSAYTLFGMGTPMAPVTYNINQTLASVDDGTNNNLGVIRRNNASGFAASAATIATVANGIGSTIVWPQGQSGKIALASGVNDQGFSYNSSVPLARTFAQPVLTAMHIGTVSTGTSLWNGYIERIALWPTKRLSDTNLQLLTARPT